jgi:hypothetical protein
MNTTTLPTRVRFVSGATAERIQARRDAAALTEHRKLNGILNALQGPFRLPGR